MKEFFEFIDQVITKIGINPEEARGEEPGQWVLYREETAIFIDIWQPKEATDWNYTGQETAPIVFQAISPICKLPENMLFEIYEELLQINFLLFNTTLFINKPDNIIAIKFKRIAEGISESDIFEAIEAVGYYSQLLQDYLSKKYKTQKI